MNLHTALIIGFLALSPAVFGQIGTPRLINDDVNSPISVRSADFDLDGDTDLVATHGSSGVYWYPNLGTGFAPEQLIDTAQASGAAAVDLDGDGDVDVLCTLEQLDQAVWYENLGGSFAPRQIIGSTQDVPAQIVAFDVDEDGDCDVVVGSVGDDTIAWYENLGAGFGPKQTLTTNFPFAVLDFADIDNDGDNDVVAASSTTDRVSWFPNNGSGFMPETTISVVPDNPRFIRTADMDGDGDCDVVVSSRQDGTVGWFPNSGGTFGPRQTVDSNVALPFSIEVNDIDGDGDVDVVYSSAGDGSIVWNENQGIGTFGFSQTITMTLGAAQDLHAADLDNDGDADFVATFLGSDSIYWFENSFGESVNKCVELDGTSALITPAANGLGNLTQYSVEMWVRADDENLSDTLFAVGQSGQSWEVFIGSGQEVRARTVGPSGTVMVGDFVLTDWNDGDWHHLAVTDDGILLRLYFDGELIDSNPSLGIIWQLNGTAIRIGRDFTTQEYWTGGFDEVRIWSTERSQADIEAFMFSGLDSADNLVSSWRFDGNPADATGANNALAEGAPYYVPCAISLSNFPGSREDLRIATGIDEVPTVGPDTKIASQGQALYVDLFSPEGEYTNTVPLLAAQLFLTGSPISQPIGFPEAWLNPSPLSSSAVLVLYDGASTDLGPGLLPPSGLSFGYTVPIFLSGFSVMIQGFALAPSAITGNLFFTATDAHEIQIQ